MQGNTEIQIGGIVTYENRCRDTEWIKRSKRDRIKSPESDDWLNVGSPM